MNKIILIGNLTADPEQGSTQNGKTFCRFNIAVNRTFTNNNGERVADYFNIITWSGLADNCAKYLFKGDKVGIHGSVQQNQYQRNDGTKTVLWNVVADEVEFLNSKHNNAKTAPNQQQDTKGGGQTNTQPQPNSRHTKQNTLFDDMGIVEVDDDSLPF